jgi:hypothetical protein
MTSIRKLTRLFAIVLAVAVFHIADNKARGDIISEGSGATLRYGYGTTAGGLDANTTHLWRLDEPTGTIGDFTTVTATAIPLQYSATTAEQPSILFSTGGATNSARRIDTNTSSGAGANIIRAFADIVESSTADNSDNLTPAQYNSFFGANGAFTIDFLIRPDFNPGSTPNLSAGLRIFSQEGNHAATEPNYFSLTWLGTNQLQLSTTPGSLNLDIPLTGANAFTATGQWFHVGISYNGDAGMANNTSFYWTLVDGPSTPLAIATTVANLAGTYTLSDDPTTVTSGPGPEWNIGNRPSGNRSFQGALDEFRMSNVARGAGDFIFRESPAITGDFDGDGDVDGADFIAWQTNFPKETGATLAEGDADDDDDVDGADFAIWQSGFPTEPSPGVATVPEPQSVALFAVASAILLFRRLRRTN